MVTEQLDAHLQMELPFREFQERLSMGTAGHKGNNRNALRHDQKVENEDDSNLITGPKAEY